jgi:hypothetical protein
MRNFIFLSSLFLSACAGAPMPLPALTEEVPTSQASKAVPPERLLNFQSPAQFGVGNIVVLRDQSFTGSACFYAVFINEKLSARIGSGERAEFTVPAGDVQFIAGHDPDGKGLCSINNFDRTQTRLMLREGEIRYFRLSLEHPNPKILQR